MKYYIEIDEIDIDRFRIDNPCNGSHGHCVLVLKDKYNMNIGFELLKGRLHGEWKEIYFDNMPRFWDCSECKNRNTWPSDYCPNCGADMRPRERKEANT